MYIERKAGVAAHILVEVVPSAPDDRGVVNGGGYVHAVFGKRGRVLRRNSVVAVVKLCAETVLPAGFVQNSVDFHIVVVLIRKLLTVAIFVLSAVVVRHFAAAGAERDRRYRRACERKRDFPLFTHLSPPYLPSTQISETRISLFLSLSLFEISISILLTLIGLNEATAPPP